MAEQSGARPTGSRRNIVFAVFFLIISGTMGIHAATTMKFGTLETMGPGFFPVVLSALLALLAILVGFSPEREDAPPLSFASVKSAILVISSPLIFAATIRTLGLVLCIFITTFMVSFASRYAKVTRSLALAVGFTIFCVALFAYLLDLPIPLWGTVFEN